MATTPKTTAWCVRRNHPWSTYNPWMDRTWCRCGQRQADGQQPIDLDAVLQTESLEQLTEMEHYALGKIAATDDSAVIADETEYLTRVRKAIEMATGDEKDVR